MPTTHAPQSHEYSASPEGQVIDIRMRIVTNAGYLFSLVPVPAGADLQPQAVEPRTVAAHAMNPIVQHVMNNPELGLQAQNDINEIHRAA